MSQSTDGILAFGFDLGIEDEQPLEHLLGEDFDDLDDFLASEAGIPPWNHDSPEDYWNQKNAALAASPVELVSHCSGEYPMYILAVRGTYKNASRGYPEVLTPDYFTVPQEKINAARKWCEDHKVEWQEPSWILASMWN